VDDILLVYNKQIKDINNTLKELNEINPKLQFTTEKEKDNVINFLDITIIKNPDNIQNTRVSQMKTVNIFLNLIY
jgi:hypothetical protein